MKAMYACYMLVRNLLDDTAQMISKMEQYRKQSKLVSGSRSHMLNVLSCVHIRASPVCRLLFWPFPRCHLTRKHFAVLSHLSFRFQPTLSRTAFSLCKRRRSNWQMLLLITVRWRSRSCLSLICACCLADRQRTSCPSAPPRPSSKQHIFSLRYSVSNSICPLFGGNQASVSYLQHMISVIFS